MRKICTYSTRVCYILFKKFLLSRARSSEWNSYYIRFLLFTDGVSIYRRRRAEVPLRLRVDLSLRKLNGRKLFLPCVFSSVKEFSGDMVYLYTPKVKCNGQKRRRGDWISLVEDADRVRVYRREESIRRIRRNDDLTVASENVREIYEQIRTRSFSWGAAICPLAPERMRASSVRPNVARSRKRYPRRTRGYIK